MCINIRSSTNVYVLHLRLCTIWLQIQWFVWILISSIYKDIIKSMSETIGHLYVRSESEDDNAANSMGNRSPTKSTSLSSLRSLRDSFIRSESRTSQASLASTSTKSESVNEQSDAFNSKSGKFIQRQNKAFIRIHYCGNRNNAGLFYCAGIGELVRLPCSFGNV